MITTKKIISLEFPDNQYIKEETNKTQICIHHTVSGPSALNISNWWKSNPPRISTPIIIDREGIPYQLFSSKYWGYHLGVKEETFKQYNIPFRNLDKNTIGVELISWGGLKIKENKFYNDYNQEVNSDEVIELDKEYRGYKYFQKYTSEQLNTLKELLQYWTNLYNIPKMYNDNIWNFKLDSIKGVPGIYSHTSYRQDKSDCYPDVNLINILKTL